VGNSRDREKVPCRKGSWSEKQPVKVQSRSIARIDRRFTQLRAHLRASTQEQCAPNTGARPKEVLFLKSSILGILCLVGGDNSHQGKPFTTRTAPSKVRMARGNAIKMPIQAASATHRDRKPLAAIELFSTLLREEEEKGEISSTPS
jgi:hypothetical protein